MLRALQGFVLEVEAQRRQEDEQQDEGDQDVVVQAAPLVGPQDVSADCPAQPAHGVVGKCRRKLSVESRSGFGNDRRPPQKRRAEMRSAFMYGRSASGTTTLPSACW